MIVETYASLVSDGGSTIVEEEQQQMLPVDLEYWTLAQHRMYENRKEQ